MKECEYNNSGRSTCREDLDRIRYRVLITKFIRWTK